MRVKKFFFAVILILTLICIKAGIAALQPQSRIVFKPIEFQKEVASLYVDKLIGIAINLNLSEFGLRAMLKRHLSHLSFIEEIEIDREDYFKKLPPDESRWSYVFLDTLKLCAYEAKKKGESIAIGLETKNWIPEEQKNIIQPLLSELYRLSEHLKKIGLDNVIIARGVGGELAEDISRKINNKSVDLEDVVIVATEKTLSLPKFNKFRSTKEEKRAFFVGIDPRNIAPLDYIRILEKLTIALRAAYDNNVPQTYHSNITVEPAGVRAVRLKHKEEPKDYNELRKTYELQRKCLRDP